MPATRLQPHLDPPATRPPRARRQVSVIPRRCGPISGARLTDRDLLARVRISDHALQRFAERAGLKLNSRAELTRIVEDLLLQEGLCVPSPPPWAHLRRPSPWEPTPLYLQAGFWMLFVARPDPRSGPSYRKITTAIVAAPDRTWAQALERGDIGTPPPPGLPTPAIETISRRSSVAIALRRYRSPVTLLGGIGALHRERQQSATRAYAAAIAERDRVDGEYRAARERARDAHLRRHGFLT